MHENGQLAGKKESKPPDGLDGIRYFEFLDQVQRVLVENPNSAPGSWSKAAYYPGAEMIRLSLNGQKRMKTFSVRVGGWATMDQAEYGKFLPEIIQALIRNGVSADDLAKTGFPEVQQIVEKIKNNPPLKSAKELQPGKHYLVNKGRYVNYDKKYLTDYNFIFQFTSAYSTLGANTGVPNLHLVSAKNAFGSYQVYEIAVSSSGRAAYEVCYPRGVVKGEIDGYRSVTRKFETIDGFDFDQESLQVWEIPEADASIIMRLAPPEYDPFENINMTRTEICLSYAFQALQFVRWGQDEDKTHPERYEQVNKQTYESALDALLNRFGLPQFLAVAKQICLIHLAGLHTNLHEAAMPYQPHSDISPFEEKFVSIAADATNHQFPLPTDLYDYSGYAVGNVNAKTLFGDLEFWQWLASKSQFSVRELASYLLTINKRFEQTSYAKTEMDVVAVMRDHFSKTYEFVHQLVPEFETDTVTAIRVLSK